MPCAANAATRRLHAIASSPKALSAQKLGLVPGRVNQLGHGNLPVRVREGPISFPSPIKTGSVLPATRRFALILAIAGCSSSSQSGETAASPAQRTPAASQALPGALSRFATENIIVLPLQGLAGADPLGWRQLAGSEVTFIARVDTLLEQAVTERRLGGRWAFPTALNRAYRRNPTYLIDPYSVRATHAILTLVRKQEDPLAEPVAGQLRAMAGVSDARYALVPVEVRFEGTQDAGQLAMRLAVLDVRAARLLWWGEVRGEPHTAYTRTVLDDLIQRVADVVIPR